MWWGVKQINSLMQNYKYDIWMFHVKHEENWEKWITFMSYPQKQWIIHRVIHIIVDNSVDYNKGFFSWFR